MRRPSAAAGLAAAVLAVTGTAGCGHRGAEPSPSLVRPAPATALSAPAQDNFGRILLPMGSTILVEGDQTAYAPALATERRAAPAINGVALDRLPDAWPIRLSQRLRRQVQVTQAVYPDDLASDGLSRWSTTPPGDVNILMYGANEATRDDDPVPDSAFFKALQALSDRARAHGGWVVLVVPPPYPDKGLNARLAPYRAVMHLMAEQPNTLLFDPARTLAATPGAYASKRRLSDAGQRALGDAIAGLFLVTPRAG